LINNGFKLAALLLLAGFLTFAVWNLREFGEPGEKADNDVVLYNAEDNTTLTLDRTAMDDFMLDHSQDGSSTDEDVLENGPSANNAVTAVVFDYRGFDTMGEATVLFAAVSGVLVSLRIALPPKEKKGGDA